MAASYHAFRRRQRCIRKTAFAMWVELIGSGAYSNREAASIQAKRDNLGKVAWRLFQASRRRAKGRG